MKELIRTYLFRGLIVVLVLFFSGCDNYLDVNHNPNSPEQAPVRMQLSPIIAGFSFEMNDSWPGIVSADFTQQISENGSPYYYDIDWYQLGQPWFGFSSVWDEGYTTLAKNARSAYMNAEKQGYSNYEGMAKLMFVWTMSMMTDLYGDIPYSQAFDPTVTTPAYDPQKEIYPKLMKKLDEAIAALEKGGTRTLGSDDLIYNGDMTKWLRLAYTLKARLLMRLSEAPDNKKQQRAQDALDALSKGFQSNDDNATFPYMDKNGSRNPWYRTLQGSEQLQMSAHYINLLQSLNDPRLPIQAQEANEHPAGQPYIGHENGAPGTSVDSVSSIGTAFAGPAAPGRLMDYAEAKFLEAQAKLITQGPSAADQPYREAIRADMEELGVADSKITTYISNRTNLASSSNPLRDIITQKYIANFLNPEAWNDWRKTGYPSLSPSKNPNNVEPNFNSIPRRYPWPGSELSNNSDQVKKLGLPMNADVMLKTVWWDTR